MKRIVITIILATVCTIGTSMTTYAAGNTAPIIPGAQIISCQHEAVVGDDKDFYQYSNGIWVEKINMPTRHECFDKKYWILRTDFSDGLLDVDHNGIDDRDPYNTCGFTDLNYNGIADGAPTNVPDFWAPESEPMYAYEMCDHGVVAGWKICQHPDCEAFREGMKHIHII